MRTKKIKLRVCGYEVSVKELGTLIHVTDKKECATGTLVRISRYLDNEGFLQTSNPTVRVKNEYVELRTLLEKRIKEIEDLMREGEEWKDED